MKNVHLLHKPSTLSIWVFNNQKRIGMKTMPKSAWKRAFEYERQIIGERGGRPIFTEEEYRNCNPKTFTSKYALFVEYGSRPFIDSQLLASNSHSVLVIAMMPNPLEAGGKPRLTFYEHAHCESQHKTHAQVDLLVERIKYRYAKEKQERKRQRQLILI